MGKLNLTFTDFSEKLRTSPSPKYCLIFRLVNSEVKWAKYHLIFSYRNNCLELRQLIKCYERNYGVNFAIVDVHWRVLHKDKMYFIKTEDSSSLLLVFWLVWLPFCFLSCPFCLFPFLPLQFLPPFSPSRS